MPDNKSSSVLCHIFEFNPEDHTPKDYAKRKKELSLVRDKILDRVCKGLSLIPHIDGNSYCIFHHPTKKSENCNFIEDFARELEKKIDTFDKDVARIESEFPADLEKQRNAFASMRYDFRYVWFPDHLDLSKRKFYGKAYFSAATFQQGVNFSKASFLAEADFEQADFEGFCDFYKTGFPAGAFFGKAKFKRRAYFKNAEFAGETNFDKSVFFMNADFNSANFTETSEISFKNTRFESRVSFKYAVFAGYVLFRGDKNNRVFGKKSYLSMPEARLKNPKRISFHTVRLEPSWFVDTNASEFDFTDCKWCYGLPRTIYSENVKKEFEKFVSFVKKARSIKTIEKLDALYEKKYGDGKRVRVRHELYNLRHRNNPHALLTKTCWQLAHNHEESKSFAKASRFRRLAQESKRLGDYAGLKFWSWHWWYWFSSQYGESPFKAGLILLGILLFFAAAYNFTEFRILGETCPKMSVDNMCVRFLRWDEALLQSLATATFQNIEYFKTHSKLSSLLIILEKILAPLQAALLALAIRRKFMR